MMNEQELLQRIALDPKIMAGKPVIRGVCLAVEHTFATLAHGATPAEILAEYPGLQPADLQACYLFATKTLRETDFLPLTTGAA